MSTDVGTAIGLRDNLLSGEFPTTLTLSHVAVRSLVPLHACILALPAIAAIFVTVQLPNDEPKGLTSSPASTVHQEVFWLQEFDCSWNNITEDINDALYLTYAKRLMLR